MPLYIVQYQEHLSVSRPNKLIARVLGQRIVFPRHYLACLALLFLPGLFLPRHFYLEEGSVAR